MTVKFTAETGHFGPNPFKLGNTLLTDIFPYLIYPAQ